MNVKIEIDNQMKEDLIILKSKEYTKNIKDIVNNIENRKLAIHGTFIFKDGSKKEALVALKNIYSFSSNQKKVYGYTKSEEFFIKIRLYELDNVLSDNFIRISNTEIINLDYVKEFNLTSSGMIQIKFINERMTSSSRRYLKRIKERLL